MANLILEAENREESGKNSSRRLRRAGRIPGVVYGLGIDPISVSVDPKDVVGILHSESGHNTIFKLSVGQFSQEVIIRDYQLDPLRDSLVHTDFQTISMDTRMNFDVPVSPVGTAAGVKLGGILEILMREVSVECLPTEVPDRIEVDVTELEIGDTVHVSDLTIDREKVNLMTDGDRLVIAVGAPSLIQEEEEEEEVLPEDEAVPAAASDEDEGGEE